MFDFEDLVPLLRILRRYSLLIIVAVFVLVVGGQFLLYLRAVAERDTLQEQINRTAAITTGARSRIAEVEERYNAVREGLPSPGIQEIDVFRQVIQVAESVGLNSSQIVQTYIGDKPSIAFAGTQFQALSFKVDAEGSEDRILDFVEAMDAGGTGQGILAVDTVELTLGGAGRASIDFTVYTRPE